MEGKVGSLISRGLSSLGFNDLNASGGKLALGVAVSFPFFDGAIFDGGIVATAAATDVSVDPKTSFVSLPGVKGGVAAGASTGSVSDLRGQSISIKAQSNIGKKASGLLVDGLKKLGLPKSVTGALRKTAGSLGGLVVSGALTGSPEEGITGVEIGAGKGLNAGVSADVGYTAVCTLRTGC